MFVRVLLVGGAVLACLASTGLLWMVRSYTSNLLPSYLIDDKGFISEGKVGTEYENKYGAKYANLLLGLGVENDHWWQILFLKYSSKNAKGGFENLESATKRDAQNDKSLKTACEKAYKSDPANIVSKESDVTDSTKFLDTQVWWYCSLLLTIPKTLKQMEEDEGDNEDKTKLLNDLGEFKAASDKKEELLAIFSSENRSAWEMLDAKRRGVYPGWTIDLFSRISGTNIRKDCEEIYKQEKTAFESQPLAEEKMYRWCSARGYKPVP